MNMRERRELIESGVAPDRFPALGIHPWRETLLRWEKEGMKAGVSHNEQLQLHQDNDTILLPVNMVMAPRYDVEVLAENREHVTVRDEFGVVRKMPRSDYEVTGGYMMMTGLSSTMSEFLSYPLTDRSSWLELLNSRFSTSLAGCTPSNWSELVPQFQEQAKEKYLLITGYPILGAVGGLRQMMGLEGMIFQMMDEPELIREVWNTLVNRWILLFEELFQVLPLDHFVFFEDMCSTLAPIISPAMFLDFFGEGYRRICDVLKQHNVRLIDVDTDGNARQMIEPMMSLGVNMLSPCQASAGMDCGELLRQYPTLQLRGGINIPLLATGDKEVIWGEVKRCYAAAWKYGRYIPEPEHGVPPTVSWDGIRHFADAMLHYSRKAP